MFIYCVSYPKLVFINTGFSACKQTLLQHTGGGMRKQKEGIKLKRMEREGKGHRNDMSKQFTCKCIGHRQV